MNNVLGMPKITNSFVGRIGHNLGHLRLVGSKFGLSGHEDMIIHRKLPAAKPFTHSWLRQMYQDLQFDIL